MQLHLSMIVIAAMLVASSNAFWWGGAVREPEPQPVVKQMPVGYFRTFTYQPLPFNPALANQYFSYPAATKMINPLQYLPQKAYTQLSANSLSPSYTGPLQAQQTVNQPSHEPSPVAAAITSSSSTSSSVSSNSAQAQSYTAAAAPMASIAESLTSDAHLPIANAPMPQQSQQPQYQQQQAQQQSPQQQQQQPLQPPQQYQQLQQQQPQQQLQFSPVAPIPASNPIQYSTAPTARLASVPSSSFMSASFGEPSAQQQQPYNMPYMMAGSPMPMQPVQFVPCMCPVSYAMASAPEMMATKRSDELLTTIGDYQAMDTTMNTASAAVAVNVQEDVELGNVSI